MDTVAMGYVVKENAAVEEDEHPGLVHTTSNNVRRGHRCCGCCCDVRRAVIIVNTVNIVICLFALLGISVLSRIDPATIDDDEARAKIESISDMQIDMGIAEVVIQIICQSIGIYGAVCYNQYLVGVSLLCYVAIFIVDLVQLELLGAIAVAFFAYPSVFFIKQMRNGIMSESTYSIEKHSCCCV
jgi:hypothetical protein